MGKQREYDLEDRLIQFSINMIEISEQLPNTKVGNHIAGQLVRCGTHPALNYGEVQGAESRRDFVHKMKGILKELRETRICLKIIKRKPLIKPFKKTKQALNECNEPISIFATSIKTAEKNKNDNKK